MARRKNGKAADVAMANQQEPERAPTDPTLDPVDEPVVDVIEPVVEVTKDYESYAELKKDLEEAGVAVAVAPVDYVADQIAQARAREEALAGPPAPAGPFDAVKVRNLGHRAWVGSDYAAVGFGHVAAGRVGTVTRKKAEQLLAGQHVGVGRGIGPFELVEE